MKKKNVRRQPFPWFGGKDQIADYVWERFEARGLVTHYVEPFCGAAAVFLARHGGNTPLAWRKAKGRTGLDIINDLDAFVSNLWRSVRDDALLVHRYANGPRSDVDLRSRENWLTQRWGKKGQLLQTCLNDPEFHCAQTAGYWLYCTCRSRYQESMRNPGQEPCFQLSSREEVMSLSFILALKDRLDNVDIACEDGAALLQSLAATSRFNRTRKPKAFFIDPCYRACKEDTYSICEKRHNELLGWCAENGKRPDYRIAICGHIGEYNLPGWYEWPWVNRRSHLRGHDKECVWFSPACGPAPSE